MDGKNHDNSYVYSTNKNFDLEPKLNLSAQTLPPGQQDLRVRLDRKHRGGKEATLISGFSGKESDLQELGKLLKQKCGTGGTVKDNEILIQGDKVHHVMEILSRLGYRVKRSGG